MVQLEEMEIQNFCTYYFNTLVALVVRSLTHVFYVFHGIFFLGFLVIAT